MDHSLGDDSNGIELSALLGPPCRPLGHSAEQDDDSFSELMARRVHQERQVLKQRRHARRRREREVQGVRTRHTGGTVPNGGMGAEARAAAGVPGRGGGARAAGGLARSHQPQNRRGALWPEDGRRGEEEREMERGKHPWAPRWPRE